MIELGPHDFTSEIKSMFNPNDPAGLRCTGVFDDILPGRVFVDRIQDPSWAIAQEKIFGTIYLAGKTNSHVIKNVIDHTLTDWDVLLGVAG